MHFVGNVVGRIGRLYCYLCLKDGVSLVVVAVDEVDCYAGFVFSALLHGFVYVHSVHSFSAELRQQGGVYVDYATWIFINKVFGNQPEKSGEDYEVDVVFAEVFHYLFAVVELGTVEGHRVEV